MSHELNKMHLANRRLWAAMDGQPAVATQVTGAKTEVTVQTPKAPGRTILRLVKDRDEPVFQMLLPDCDKISADMAAECHRVGLLRWQSPKPFRDAGYGGFRPFTLRAGCKL